MDTTSMNTIESAMVVVPLRALVTSDGLRYVDSDDVHQVHRTSRKYLELTEQERAIVERIAADLYDLFEQRGRSLVELVAATQLD